MRTAAVFFAALALAACAQDVGEGKTKAEIVDPAPTESVEVADAARTLAVDPAQSKLGLIGAKITRKHPIHLNEYTGEVTLDGDGNVTGVSFVAQVASIESDVDRLTEHLKKEEFLYVDKFPTADFKSVSITDGAEGEGMTHTVTGDLTIRGQTKRITFPAKIDVGDDGVTASTEFVIDRQDFKVTYPGMPDDLVQDNVLMQISFMAPNA